MGAPAIAASDEDPRIRRLVAALVASGFGGDVETGFGVRQVAATDNSIYEVRPAAIVYPAGDAGYRAHRPRRA